MVILSWKDNHRLLHFAKVQVILSRYMHGCQFCGRTARTRPTEVKGPSISILYNNVIGQNARLSSEVSEHGKLERPS